MHFQFFPYLGIIHLSHQCDKGKIPRLKCIILRQGKTWKCIIFYHDLNVVNQFS